VSGYAGLDLGRQYDRTALAVLDVVQRDEVRELRVTGLWRAPQRLGYPQQAEMLATMFGRPEMAGIELAVDATGVGVAVVDLLRERLPVSFVALTITGGSAINAEGLKHGVPKRDLISGLQVVMGQRRLKVAPSLDLAAELLDEFGRFGVSISATGHDSYGASSGHDDLVLALSYAVYLAERGNGARAWIAYTRDMAAGTPPPEPAFRVQDARVAVMSTSPGTPDQQPTDVDRLYAARKGVFRDEFIRYYS
jgi:hypothetical protein